VRVLIDTTFLRRAPRSGTAIYIERLCDALEASGDVDLIRVANPARKSPAGGGLGSVLNASRDLLWSTVQLPQMARAAHATVVHHPLPALAPPIGGAQVVTVHDLAFELMPEAFDANYRRYSAFAHRAAARRAAMVIAVSDSTAADIKGLWAIPAQRIVVARHGPGQQLKVTRRRKNPLHFLYVGDDEPRKDLPTLLAAYAEYRHAAAKPLALVLAGQFRMDYAGDGVIIESDVSTERLAQLHAGAAALVHPAHHEGFGMTLLEAMACGTPVLVARSYAVEEVCGEAVLYFPPADEPGLLALLTEVAGSPERRGELAASGKARAERFSWADSARAHIDAYSLASEMRTFGHR
jgi:glycosyltransferase involved in cell wall biosynthesis